jgi:hypothetical protein
MPHMSPQDLRRFLVWAADHLGYSELRAVHDAEPTAELEPLREGVPPQVGDSGGGGCGDSGVSGGVGLDLT